MIRRWEDENFMLPVDADVKVGLELRLLSEALKCRVDADKRTCLTLQTWVR